MMNLSDRQVYFPYEQKISYFQSLTQEELYQVLDFKTFTAASEGNRKEALKISIAEKTRKYDYLVANMRMGEASAVLAEIKALTQEKNSAEKSAQLYNIEACMAYIEHMRRAGKTEKDVTPKEREAFPLRTWVDLENFLIKNANYYGYNPNQQTR